MINEKELRIGNLIFNHYNNVKTVFTINKNMNNGHPLNPIPLTEEWLIKFGFEKTDFGGKCFSYGDILIYPNESEYRLFAHQYIKGALKYVHQLQNLYFALTGEELTLK